MTRRRSTPAWLAALGACVAMLSSGCAPHDNLTPGARDVVDTATPTPDGPGGCWASCADDADCDAGKLCLVQASPVGAVRVCSAIECLPEGVDCACGDGVCNAICGEQIETCPCDCHVEGDGLCSPCGENPLTAPVDCCRAPGADEVGCGDGFCMGYGCGEDPQSCPEDCGTACGDGACSAPESPQTCPEDCRHQVCGNGICEPTDGGPAACPQDCAPTCGDCVCDPALGETLFDCPVDCGACGDGQCSVCPALNEDASTCPADCCVPSEERCDGVDNDCDEAVDEEGADGCVDYSYDADGDGLGTALGPTRCLCAPEGAWTAVVVGDCDDSDKAVGAGGTETCNGRDDDCDGVVDNGFDVGGSCIHPNPCVRGVMACDDLTATPACLSGGLKARGEACGLASCAGAVVVDAPWCDDDGTCVPGGSLACTVGSTCGYGVSGTPTCVLSGEGLGQPCVGDEGCNIGSCVDGVCCDAPCDGDCESCALPGSTGACTLIAAGSDPDGECGDERCMTGFCDGAGACGVASDGDTCSVDSCVLGVLETSGTCMTGECVPGTSQYCASGLACASNVACLTSCTSNADCREGRTCDVLAGVCTADTSCAETQGCLASADVVFYAGGAGNERIYDALRLSDGTILVVGGAENLSWVPPGTPTTEWPATGILGPAGSGRYGFVMRLTGDLSQVLEVVHLPVDVVDDLRRIRATGETGQPTGAITVSGTTSPSKAAGTGIVLLRLAGNFTDNTTPALAWVRNVWAAGAHRDRPIWDVDGDGRVLFAEGEPDGTDWAALFLLEPDGQDAVVEGWRRHWVGASLPGTEITGPIDLANYTGPTLLRSGVALTPQARCDLRSTTVADYSAVASDGNGSTRQGTWPNDVLFDGPCDDADPLPVGAGAGYTGYRASPTTHLVGAITSDRATGDWYVGYSATSTTPDGQPGRETAIIAFAPNGAMRWWSRLAKETVGESSARQYVDQLVVDPVTGTLLVGARAEGFGTANFWSALEVGAGSGANSFLNNISGNGSPIVAWLGRLAMADGTTMRATFVAEPTDTLAGYSGMPHPDPQLDGWLELNNGTLDLSSTWIDDLAVDALGRPTVVGSGQRAITTIDAFQEQTKVASESSGRSDFVRLYRGNLWAPRYSSLLRDAWAPSVPAGPQGVELLSVIPTLEGAFVFGWSTTNGSGTMPTSLIPTWGRNAPLGEDMVFGFLRY